MKVKRKLTKKFFMCRKRIRTKETWNGKGSGFQNVKAELGIDGAFVNERSETY